MHDYTRHFFTRVVWVGYHNRPGLIAWRGRINWFLPFVLRTFWQIFVIADGALGTWRFTLVNRNLTGFWRVGVRLGMTVCVPDRHWYFNRFLRAVWVGYFYRPRALARLRYIWFFRPVCFKVLDWLLIWIRDLYSTLGIWHLVQVRRYAICRLYIVLVGVTRHHIDRYVHRISRLIWISDCYLPGCWTILSNLRCRFPRYLSVRWEGRVFIIFILGYYDPGWGFITLLDFYTAWHIRRLTSLSINQIRIRILFGVGLLDH